MESNNYAISCRDFTQVQGKTIKEALKLVEESFNALIKSGSGKIEKVNITFLGTIDFHP